MGLPGSPGRPKSADHRARIAAGQRARWKRMRDVAELFRLSEHFIITAAEEGDPAALYIVTRARELDAWPST